MGIKTYCKFGNIIIKFVNQRRWKETMMILEDKKDLLALRLLL